MQKIVNICFWKSTWQLESMFAYKGIQAQEYVLDTNLADFVLGGELWSREPASLMRARLEIFVSYE